MVNHYMDEYLQTDSLVAKAKAEKYAKIISKTVMNSGGFDSANAGQNAFFYDSAEGLITAVILVIAEFCSPYGYYTNENGLLELDQKRAAVVRFIFDEYLEGNGVWRIAKSLNEQKIPTKTGKAAWLGRSIYIILKNSIYTGDLLLQ